MYLAFYISSHGFGHMTRCLSIIKNILNNTEYKIYVVCDKKQNDFAKIYLSKFVDRVIYKDLVTDIGLVNKTNSLEVDKNLLQDRLKDFVNTFDNVAQREYAFLKTLDVKAVICDISPIGCMVGNKLNIPTIFISNFSWVEQYEYIGIDEDIINKFRDAYKNTTHFIRYDLCLDTCNIDANKIYNVGFVCRDIDENRVRSIKNEYGDSIFITCGKSANLDTINVKNYKGTIFTTSGIDIVCDEGRVVNLPIEVLDTQNYIAASDIIISKAGWGTIAEGVVGHSNLVLIERPSAKEDSFNIESIKNRRLGISISEEELGNIDIDEIRQNLHTFIDYDKLVKYENSVYNVVSTILDSI